MSQLRDAVRALRATPLVTAVAILSLALGIGANTAMFSIVDALLLRPLPVRDAGRLALLSADDTWYGTAWSNPVWEAIRDRRVLHDGAFAYNHTGFNLAQAGAVDAVEGLQASGAMFDVLGVRAAVGRTFTTADDRRDGGPDGPVAVIGWGFWQRRYGGARDVVGRTITLNRVPFTIVGVTPRGFFGPEAGASFDVAVPLGTVALLNGDAGPLESRSSWWLRVLLRLPQGRTLEQATAALRTVQPRVADETRPTDVRPQDAANHLARPFTLLAGGTSMLGQGYRRPVLALMAIVSLTLLVACGNVANLLLARAAARRHELGVRTALGASGWRLARQLLAESVLLSSLGAALGVAFAVWGGRLVVSLLSTAEHRVFLPVGVDWRMLAFTAAVALGTALLFGVVPAWRAARVSPSEAMQAQGGGRTVASPGAGLAGALVTAQVALSLVLLVAAGLFVRSFAALAARDLGFEPERVLLVHVGAPGAGIPMTERLATFDRLLAAARTVPGVSHAALSMTTPTSGDMYRRMMEIPEHPDLPEAERLVARNTITPGWFAAFGTPLVAGRDFDERDRVGAPRAVIVNRAFAAKYYGGANPIGRRILEAPSPTADRTPLEIVGVVGDAVYREPRDAVPPTMYWPLAQQARPPAGMTLIVRARTGAPAALARATTTAVAGVRSDLQLVARPLAEQVDATLTQERLLATLSGFFGALALLLAGLGLYGLASYAVARRRTELGIRMALGTTPRGVVALVLGRVGRLVAGGVVLGAAVGWWAAALVGALLYGLPPRDPGTMLGAIAVLVGVGLAAGALPAARAARIDPARVLRDG